MSAISDALRSAANELDSAPALLWPTSVDCLGGPRPSMPALTTPLNAYQTTKLIYFERMQTNVKAGSVLFLGDSLFDAMCVSDITPFGLNLAIGGEDTRQLLNRLGAGDNNPIHRAAGLVILDGVNDYSRERTAGATHAQAIENIALMWSAKILPWVTGPLIVCRLLPVDDSVVIDVTNAVINEINAALEPLWAAQPNCRIVNVTASLAPNGQLLPQYHIGDGLHLSGAGYAILKAALKSALASLGIN